MGFEKGHMPRRRRLFVLCLAVIFALAAASCAARSTPVPRPELRPTDTPAPTMTPTPTRTPEPLPTLTPTPTPTPPYLITTIAAGETIALGDLVLTVSRVLTPTLDEAPAAEAGRQLVLLDVAIQNAGDRVVGINSARELVLKDSADQVYKIGPAAVAAVGGTTLDVDLAPGETVRARIGFDVPAEAGDLMLSFGADKFGAGRIFVRLP
ncbi:MAG TPA: DUF4352 domain-containing protein [Anaerolineae bacterium]|nr:DUF4352 domain-containing protein [Anaerolineae bacterium]